MGSIDDFMEIFVKWKKFEEQNNTTLLNLLKNAKKLYLDQIPSHEKGTTWYIWFKKFTYWKFLFFQF